MDFPTYKPWRPLAALDKLSWFCFRRFFSEMTSSRPHSRIRTYHCQRAFLPAPSSKIMSLYQVEHVGASNLQFAAPYKSFSAPYDHHHPPSPFIIITNHYPGPLVSLPAIVSCRLVTSITVTPIVGKDKKCCYNVCSA